MPTSPIDLVVIAYSALEGDEQEVLLRRLNEVQLRKLAVGEGETARHIASLRRVAEHVGRSNFSIDEYRNAYKRFETEATKR